MQCDEIRFDTRQVDASMRRGLIDGRGDAAQAGGLPKGLQVWWGDLSMWISKRAHKADTDGRSSNGLATDRWIVRTARCNLVCVVEISAVGFTYAGVVCRGNLTVLRNV